MKSVAMSAMGRIVTIALFVSALAACGGGGGNPGTSSGGSSSGSTGSTGTPDGSTTVPTSTILTVQLLDSRGVVVDSVPANSGGQIVATLKTAVGTPVVGGAITLSQSSSLFKPVGNSTVVTDSAGVSKFAVQRVSLSQFGKASITLTYAGNPSSGSGAVTCSATVQCTSGSSNSIDLRADPPSFLMDLRDTLNTKTTSVGATGLTTVRATLQFADGTPVTQKKVDLSGDLTQIAFPNGSSQLTDASGVASIKVSRASLTAKGAGTLKAQAEFSGVDSASNPYTNIVTANLDYQVGDANITLTNLDAGSSSLQSYGNRTVSVQANVNGIASTTPVQVTFNASCGTIAPTTVATNASGIASTTYKADAANCQGTIVTISAAVAGASAISNTVVVLAPVATNVQFVSVTPQLIYLQGSVGSTQAQSTFKVVDSSGNALSNKKLRISLSNLSTGVSLNTLGSTAPVDVTTDSNGLGQVAIYSGTVPTSLIVRATLLDSAGTTTSIFSDSNLLTVASGRPVQRSLSLAATALSIEGFNVDGAETTLTLSMSDRQGNPVPPGTQVNFVTETGVMLPAVCFVVPPIPATDTSPAIPQSYCSAKLRSGGNRAANGRVSVLAYVEGEEDFVDANGNNVYDPGETFNDLGRAYRDDNSFDLTAGSSVNGQPIQLADGVYNTGEFQVPRIGVPACNAAVGCVGDGVWGSADVRKKIDIVFATSAAKLVTNGSDPITSGGGSIWLSDLNNNSVPAGATVAVAPIRPSTCKILFGPAVISNTNAPTLLNFGFDQCAGGAMKIDVTYPKVGTSTNTTINSFTVNIP